MPSTCVYKNNNALNAWFCVVALTFLSTARWLRNASISAFPHIGRMLFLMKKDIAFYPADITFFRLHAIVSDTDLLANKIKKFLFYHTVHPSIHRTFCPFITSPNDIQTFCPYIKILRTPKQ